MTTRTTHCTATLRHGRHLFFFSGWLANPSQVKRATIPPSAVSRWPPIVVIITVVTVLLVVLCFDSCTVLYIPCRLELVFVCGGSSQSLSAVVNREVITAQGYYYTLLSLSLSPVPLLTYCVATRLYFTSARSVTLCSSITTASTFDLIFSFVRRVSLSCYRSLLV